MFELLGIPPQALFGQLLLGLINGSFYAILSLGLAVIFGLLNIINFSHGAQFMMGAFVAWMLLSLGNQDQARIGLGLMLIPLVVLLLDSLLTRLKLDTRLRLLIGAVVAAAWGGSLFLEG